MALPAKSLIVVFPLPLDLKVGELSALPVLVLGHPFLLVKENLGPRTSEQPQHPYIPSIVIQLL